MFTKKGYVILTEYYTCMYPEFGLIQSSVISGVRVTSHKCNNNTLERLIYASNVAHLLCSFQFHINFEIHFIMTFFNLFRRISIRIERPRKY